MSVLRCWYALALASRIGLLRSSFYHRPKRVVVDRELAVSDAFEDVDDTENKEGDCTSNRDYECESVLAFDPGEPQGTEVLTDSHTNSPG